MATYEELFDIVRQADNNTLLNRVAVAVTVKAQAVMSEATPPVEAVTWAARALADQLKEARLILPYVLAANKDATVSQITSASDATIQTNVDAAADQFIAAGVVS